jgi:integrase
MESAIKRNRRRAGRRDFGTIKADGTPSNPAFSVRWYEGGRQRRKRGLRSRTEAEAFLARVRTALTDGVLEAHRKSEVTFSVVADEWLRNHSAVKLRSHADNAERWKRLAIFFGKSSLLSDITPSRILELREHLRSEGLAPATVNRYLALLRSVLNYAVVAGYLQASPIRRFSRGSYLLPEPHLKRSPPLASNTEAAGLLDAIRDESREWFAFFAFLLLTGVRRGEAAGLRWEDVDLSRRLVTIRRSYDAPTKSGRARTVPISTELARVLTEHRARDRWGRAPVFPHPDTGELLTHNVKIGLILDAACGRAGIVRMRTHDLRHAHASLWLMAGGSLADVQRNLGHSTPVLTSETYGHIAEDHRIKEVDERLRLGLSGTGSRLADTDRSAEGTGIEGMQHRSSVCS